MTKQREPQAGEAVGPRLDGGVRRLVDPVGPVAVLVQPKLPRVQFYPNKPGESYRPCNGSEGESFHAMWCEECERDKVMSGQATVDEADNDPGLYCEILNRSFRSDEPLPEWTYGADGQPCCTQFVPVGRPVPAPRCQHTADLFDGGEPLTPNVRAKRGVGRLDPERDQDGPRGTYGCACLDRDSVQCAAIRYGMDHYGEACTCLCHQWGDDDEY